MFYVSGLGPCLVIKKEALKCNTDMREETLNLDYRFREGLKVSAARKLTCQKFCTLEKR